MNKLTERLLPILLILFILLYVGYQAYGYYFNPYKTEAAFAYTISHSVNAKGVALRKEKIIAGQFLGVETCFFEDATWVSVGEPVIEFHENNSGDAGFRRMREIDSEVQRLKSAQDSTINNYSNTDSLSRDIKNQLGQLVAMSNTGRFENLEELRPDLVTLINKRQIATGKEHSFSARITQLEAERSNLQAASGMQGAVVVKSPASGYFVREVDGYELLELPANLAKSTFADLAQVMEQEPDAASVGRIGKVVLTPEWYFLARMPKYDAQWLVEGGEPELLFDAVAGTIPAGIVRVVQEKDSEDAMVVFKSNRINEEIVNLRTSEVSIQFRQYNGLRISTSAIRFQNNERGVYVLQGGEIRFKKIDPIYEEQSFLLSKEHTDPEDTGWVKMFDLVVVKGNDLYDGKKLD